jgi:hypothetical protein
MKMYDSTSRACDGLPLGIIPAEAMLMFSNKYMPFIKKKRHLTGDEAGPACRDSQ